MCGSDKSFLRSAPELFKETTRSFVNSMIIICTFFLSFQDVTALRDVYCHHGTVRCSEEYVRKEVCVIYTGIHCLYPCSRENCVRHVFYNDACPIFHCSANPNPPAPPSPSPSPPTPAKNTGRMFLYLLASSLTGCGFYLVATVLVKHARQACERRSYSVQEQTTENRPDQSTTSDVSGLSEAIQEFRRATAIQEEELVDRIAAKEEEIEVLAERARHAIGELELATERDEAASEALAAAELNLREVSLA